MVFFEDLPEDFISNIISRNSPLDACRASFVSRGFKCAANSDAVWEQFLPSDYPKIFSAVASPPIFSTKKELYHHLAQSYLLLDGGKMSFSVGRFSGKKSYMLGAKQLDIESADDPQLWKWTSSPHSRFSVVAQLLKVRMLRIRGRLQTRLLSEKTTYIAYLVFNFPEGRYGRETAHTSVMNTNANYKKANRDNISHPIHFCGPGYRPLHMLDPRRRKDRWMEIEMGQFFNECGDDGEVVTRFAGMQFENSGLIVEGIEFRPKDG